MDLNAIIPLVTILGPMLVGLMTGSMVIETSSRFLGLGAVCKINLTNDYPTIIGVTMLYSAFILFVLILIVDLLYGLVDLSCSYYALKGGSVMAN